MSQQQLIDALSEQTKLPKNQITAVLKALPKALAEQLKGEKQTAVIPGVGNVKLVTRKARTGRNPSTGAAIQIAESIVPSIKVVKAFKDLL